MSGSTISLIYIHLSNHYQWIIGKLTAYTCRGTLQRPDFCLSTHSSSSSHWVAHQHIYSEQQQRSRMLCQVAWYNNSDIYISPLLGINQTLKRFYMHDVHVRTHTACCFRTIRGPPISLQVQSSVYQQRRSSIQLASQLALFTNLKYLVRDLFDKRTLYISIMSTIYMWMRQAMLEPAGWLQLYTVAMGIPKEVRTFLPELIVI